MLILFKKIESIDMTLCVISFLVSYGPVESHKSGQPFCADSVDSSKVMFRDFAIYDQSRASQYPHSDISYMEVQTVATRNGRFCHS